MTGKSMYFRRDTGEPVGCSSVQVDTVQDVLSMLHSGQQRKKFAATAMNDHSSRSHTALIMTVSRSSTVCLAHTIPYIHYYILYPIYYTLYTKPYILYPIY